MFARSGALVEELVGWWINSCPCAESVLFSEGSIYSLGLGLLTDLFSLGPQLHPHHIPHTPYFKLP